MENEQKVTIRVAGIIIEDNKILFLLGKGYKELWTPGGKLEEGETNEECLKRELKEEIGVDLVEAKFFKEYDGPSFYRHSERTKNIMYLAKISGDIKPDMEIESFVWLSGEDFINKKYPMIPIYESDIIPDLIKEKIWN
ncbi:MAG: NUDIX domain-containing protein [Candidatus Paceibacterota bacterium]|jgi:8-oxo-dGTP diphosphatase